MRLGWAVTIEVYEAAEEISEVVKARKIKKKIDQVDPLKWGTVLGEKKWEDTDNDDKWLTKVLKNFEEGAAGEQRAGGDCDIQGASKI